MKKKLFVMLLIILLNASLFAVVEVQHIKTIYSKDMNKKLSKLVDVALTPRNEIVLLDEGRDALYWLNDSGEIVKTIGESGKKAGKFSSPRGLFISSSGKIFIADTANNRIQVFNQKGTFLFKFGKKGAKNGEFKQPNAVFVSKKGNIYVADTGNNRIQIFSKEGIYIAKIGSSGKDKGEFANLLNVAVDERDHVYALDSGNNRVQIFDENGVLIKVFGEKGNKRGQFKSPEGMYIDKSKLYITDTGHDLIQVYEKSGDHFASFGNRGKERGQFRSPRGLVVSKNGEIIITDSKNKRVQIFRYGKKPKSPKSVVAKVPPKAIIPPAAKQVMAVFHFENVGKSAQESDYGEVVAHSLLVALRKNKYFAAIEKTVLNKTIRELKLNKQSISLENVYLMGQKLNLGAAIIGSVSKLKDTIDLNVRVVNILKQKDIVSFTEKVSSEIELTSSCEKIINKIINYYESHNKRTLSIPSNLKVTAKIKAVKINWNPNTERDIAGYYIYRSKAPDKNYKFINYTAKNEWTDKDLIAKTTYYYKISAMNIYGFETKKSIFRSAEPLPTPELPLVQGFKITSEVGQASFEWKKIEGVLGYKVYKAKKSEGPYKKIGEIKTTSFTDKKAVAFKDLFYKVTAYKDDIESKIETTTPVKVNLKQQLSVLVKSENIRKNPNPKAPIIKKTYLGEKLTYLGIKEYRNKYLKIQLANGQIGWIWYKSIKIIE